VLFVNPREKVKPKCPQDYKLLVYQPIRGQGGHLGF